MSNIGHMKKILILAFDLKGENWRIRKKIWRKLRQIGAKLKYRSHWTLPYNKRNLIGMKLVCKEIREFGGNAEVIKGEEVV